VQILNVIFAVACAVVWNSLPTDLRVLSVTAATFAKRLNINLITHSIPRFSASEDYLFLRCINARFIIIIFFIPGNIVPRG